MKIWLDDVRLPPDGWEWAKTCTEAVLLIGKCSDADCLQAISFDNDLGDGHPEGHTLLDIIEEMVFGSDFDFYRDAKFTVHSANPVAIKRMNTVIKRIEEHYEYYNDLTQTTGYCNHASDRMDAEGYCMDCDWDEYAKNPGGENV